MSPGDIVNIKPSMLIIFPPTELLVNLVVFNLLELAGGADKAEYRCRSKHSGLPSKHERRQRAVVFSRPPRERGGRVMGYVVRYNRDQTQGAGGGRGKKKGGIIVFRRVLRPKLRSDPELNYWNPQTGEKMNQCHRFYSIISVVVRANDFRSGGKKLKYMWILKER